MGRSPCCDKANVKKGPWSPDEDAILKNYLENHTAENWISLPQKAGLKRCGKSCRLRWLNYLRPDIKHGGFTEDEDNIICSLYNQVGSKWAYIASNLRGRTDNDIKNYWNTKLKKKYFGAAAAAPQIPIIRHPRPGPSIPKPEPESGFPYHPNLLPDYGFNDLSPINNVNVSGQFGAISSSSSDTMAAAADYQDGAFWGDLGFDLVNGFWGGTMEDQKSCGGTVPFFRADVEG